jgi:hypothetical protein
MIGKGAGVFRRDFLRHCGQPVVAEEHVLHLRSVSRLMSMGASTIFV